MSYTPHPLRIQRKRTNGWKMPEGAVYVGRPTKWGNQFTEANSGKYAVTNYCDRMRGLVLIGAVDLSPLRGKQLACWCPLDKPCHADILCELANA